MFRNVNLSNLKKVLQRNLKTESARECIFRASGGTNFGNVTIRLYIMYVYIRYGCMYMYVPVCPKKLWIRHCYFHLFLRDCRTNFACNIKLVDRIN